MARKLRHNSESSRRAISGSVVLRTAFEIVQRVKADDLSWSCSRGAAGALRGGGFADAADFERRQAGPRRIAGDARQAAVDHRRDAVDGDGTFGDVGGENHLALRRARYGAILLGWREIAVQR